MSRIVKIQKLYLAFMAILLLVLFFFHNTNPIKDGDIFFHLKYGEYHIQHKTLLMDHSIFSWTPSHQYYPYCTWAADVFLFTLFRMGGWPFLFAFKYLFAFFPILMVWLYSRQTDMGKHIFTPFVLIIVLLSTSIAAYMKPEIISLVFFSLLSYIYFHVKNQDATHRKRFLFWLYPPLFLFWVNIHGIVFFGLMLLALIICGELITFFLKNQHAFDAKTISILTVSGLLSAAVTALNPYGIDLHRSFFLLSTKGVPETVTSKIMAYQPLLEHVVQTEVQYVLQCWGIMVAVFTILFFANVKKFRNWDMGLLLPNLFLGVLALQISRTAFFWPVFWAMSLFYLCGRNHLNLPSLLDNAKPLVKYTLLIVISALSIFLPLRTIYSDYYTPLAGAYLGVGFSYIDPVQECEFLKKHRIGTKLFNSYNTGSYLLFDLFPKYKVFIDTRFFPYTKGDTYKKYNDFTYGRLPLKQFESEFNFDIALVEHQYSAISWFITAGDWQPIYYGISGVVFAKRHLNLPFDFNIRKLDPHRFDGLKNVVQAFDIARTAQNLNDLKTADYVIANMKKDMGHMTGFNYYHSYLLTCQKGFEAYASGDYDKALKLLWPVSFQEQHLAVFGLLRQLVNKKADILIKEGDYTKALTLLETVHTRFPDDMDLLYDTAVVAYLAATKNQSSHLDGMNIRWKTLLKQFLIHSPEHIYADVARKLLENESIPENKLPFVLNSKIKNKTLRTYNHENTY